MRGTEAPAYLFVSDTTGSTGPLLTRLISMIIILLVKVQWLRRLPCSTGYSVQNDELVSLSVHVCGFTGLDHSSVRRIMAISTPDTLD